jgi:hypothetical protein
MSGGYYQYGYEAVNHVAAMLVVQDDPRRQAFQRILVDIADALHEIERADSADAPDGAENKAVDRVLRQFLTLETFKEIRAASDEYQKQGKDQG